MSIAEQLALQGTTIDTATPVRQAQQDANANAESTQRVLGQYYQNLDMREKSRLQSTITGAVQLKEFLDNNDLEGARNFLLQRRQQLQGRIAGGENLDTQETDAAIQMLESGDIEELMNNVNGLMAAGTVYGIIQKPDVGGSTGVMVDRLIKEGSANTVEEALQLLKGGAGARGKYSADIEFGRQANFETQSGSNQSDLQYKPEIARQTAAQSAVGANQGEKQVAFQNFEASLPQLEQTMGILYSVADRASYTLTNQGIDFFQNQLGFNPGDDAAARTYYENTVLNEILPLLKPTFGAAFTKTEGEWLLGTLGDINLSPTQKRAALQSRVDSWKRHYATLAAQSGNEQSLQPFQNFPPQKQIQVHNPQTGESFMIDASDLSEAQAEGFVQKDGR